LPFLHALAHRWLRVVAQALLEYFLISAYSGKRFDRVLRAIRGARVDPLQHRSKNRRELLFLRGHNDYNVALSLNNHPSR